MFRNPINDDFRNSPLVFGVILFLFIAVIVLAASARGIAQQTVARKWNEVLLEAIRIDFPAPTVHARNLYHLSAAMWDAWATYDASANGVFYTDKAPLPADVRAARNEAISYAAYRVLSQRYTHAVDPATSQAIFDNLMASLGYDKGIMTTEGDSPAAIGNRISAQVLATTINDGANEPNGYVDDTSYSLLNHPMQLQLTGRISTDMNAPNHWQPLAFETRVTQNGLFASKVQSYVGPHWGKVTPFSLPPSAGQDPWTAVDPGQPPLLASDDDAEFKANVVSIIRYSAVLSPNTTTVSFDFSTLGLDAGDSTIIDISPASRGNRVLGTHVDRGYAVNPVTGVPYTPQMVHLGDYGRIVAEFWADGPASETPPGHWFTLANYVADQPQMVKKIGGTGTVVDDLEWDVKVYLTLGGAVHDAAIGAWGSKRAYDYVRPISMIRYMGGLGQSSNPTGPSYHPDGLPLEPGIIEAITSDTTRGGGKHEHLAGHEGEIAIYAWSGEGKVAEGQVAGDGWIRAVEWWPYQRSTFVTPAFAAYVSGHSTFSRASAEVLAAITGSDFFPGGLGEYFFPQNAFLEFEQGPSTNVMLQWATYYDAADEAGISRVFGGIHVAPDDFAGRIMGSKIGQYAWNHVQTYFGVQDTPEIITTPWDVNGSGVVDIFDLVLVGSAFGTSGEGLATDVTNDGVVNILDLVTVAAHFGEVTNPTTPAAPQVPGTRHTDLIQAWLGEARATDDGSEIFQRGIAALERFLILVVPEKTGLFQNHPNPFNPETWLPYQLASSAEVTIEIYDIRGRLIRRLNLGQQPTGLYLNREDAAYWNGRSETGEPVSSGVYFYHFQAGDYSATRKMLILK
jgi:hypothetical protein